MKIAHFADVHVGVDANSPIDPISHLPGHLVDILSAMDTMIDWVSDNNVDLVLCAGDLYHRHSPTPTLQRLVAERITRLADICPIVIIPGNHDMSGNFERASSVDVFGTLRVHNVIISPAFGVNIIHTKAGDVQIATVPYPMRQHIMTAREIQDDNLYHSRIANIISRLSENIDNNLPAILMGHFGVTGAIYGSERHLSILSDAEVGLSSLLEYDWNYVALGHIHLHQDLNDDGVPVVYSGSLERMDFGEEGQTKGFVWIDDWKWELIDLDARPWVTISVDATDSKHPTQKVLDAINTQEQLEQSVVRIIIQIEEDNTAKLNRGRIIDVIYNAGVYHLQSLQVKVIPKIRERLSLDGSSIASLDKQELLKLYFGVKGIDKAEYKPLLKLANQIIIEADNEQSQ